MSISRFDIPNLLGEIEVNTRKSILFSVLELSVFIYFLYVLFISSGKTPVQAGEEMLMFAGSLALVTVVHELSHFFTARILGYEASIDWMETSCNFFDQYLLRNHFLLIAIMPAVVITIIAAAAKILFPDFIFIAPAYLLKMLGCRDDLILFIKALRFPKYAMFYQAKDRTGYFLVFEGKGKAA